MTTQPEALRLADTTPSLRGGDWSDKAAAELRRLHEANTELLAALKWMVGNDDTNEGDEPVEAIHIGWDYLDNGKLVATYAVSVKEQTAPHLYTAPPQRQWQGLTDEDCKRMSAGDKLVAMWAEAKLKERNSDPTS